MPISGISEVPAALQEALQPVRAALSSISSVPLQLMTYLVFGPQIDPSLSPFMNFKTLVKGFQLLNVLGKGSFGTVLHVREIDKIRKDEFAVKHVDTTDEEKGVSQKEVESVKRLRHPNLVRYVNKTEHLFIQMEYCAGGSLRENLERGVLRERVDILWHIFRGSLCGLEYIHAKNFIHRDIKSVLCGEKLNFQDNILLTFDFNVRIGDFGMVTQANRHSSMTKGVGTSLYMAPEIYLKDYDKSVDIYSLAIVLFEMIVSITEVDVDYQRFNVDKFSKNRFVYPDNFGGPLDSKLVEIIKTLISQMVAEKSSNRPSATAILTSEPFLNFGALRKKATVEERARSGYLLLCKGWRDWCDLRHTLTSIEWTLAVEEVDAFSWEQAKMAGFTEEECAKAATLVIEGIDSLLSGVLERESSVTIGLFQLLLNKRYEFDMKLSEEKIESSENLMQSYVERARNIFSRYELADHRRVACIRKWISKLPLREQVTELTRLSFEVRNGFHLIVDSQHPLSKKESDELELCLEFKTKLLEAYDTFDSRDVVKSYDIWKTILEKRDAYKFCEVDDIFKFWRPLEEVFSGEPVNDDKSKIQHSWTAVELIRQITAFTRQHDDFQRLFSLEWRHLVFLQGFHLEKVENEVEVFIERRFKETGRDQHEDENRADKFNSTTLTRNESRRDEECDADTLTKTLQDDEEETKQMTKMFEDDENQIKPPKQENGKENEVI